MLQRESVGRGGEEKHRKIIAYNRERLEHDPEARAVKNAADRAYHERMSREPAWIASEARRKREGEAERARADMLREIAKLAEGAG